MTFRACVVGSVASLSRFTDLETCFTTDMGNTFKKSRLKASRKVGVICMSVVVKSGVHVYVTISTSVWEVSMHSTLPCPRPKLSVLYPTAGYTMDVTYYMFWRFLFRFYIV